MEDRAAVLLMAYGSPDYAEQAGAYFTNIRGGREPSPEAVAHLRHRYERIGGTTPLLRITRALAGRLEQRLAAEGMACRVYVGMKHWHPFIADTMRQMRDDGVQSVTAIALAPHYSRLSVGAYRQAVEEAHQHLGCPFTIRFVERWCDRPEFAAMMARLVAGGLRRFPLERRDRVTVVFTAHSLPLRIREWDDPYERDLRDSSAVVARRVGLSDWRFAWQSAGGTREPWLGPDILEALEAWRAEGVTEVLQVPIGFVSEHLEILYDIDVEAKEKARSLGMTLERTELPNARASLVRTLAAVVRGATADVAVQRRLPEPALVPATAPSEARAAGRR